MKKRKNNKEDNNKNTENKTYIYDFMAGIEPPQIYREDQKVIIIKRNIENSDADNYEKKKAKNKLIKEQDKQKKRLEKKEKHKKDLEDKELKKEQKRQLKEQKAKEKQHKKKKGKRRLKKKYRNILYFILYFIIFILILTILSITTIFKVGEVNAGGSSIYSSQQIIDASMIDIEDNILLVNKNRASKQIQHNLPYIYDVNIKVKLPETVEIEVVDAKPRYRIVNKDKTSVLLDDNFKVLDKAYKGSAENVIDIVNIGTSKIETGDKLVFKDEEISKNLKLITKAIDSTKMESVTAISSTGANNNVIVYDNRLTFNLGTCDDLENKIYKGLSVCAELNSKNENIKGDLDITDGKQIYFIEK